MTTSPTLRIGCGAGFSADRLEPAVDLARRGRLDVLVFECIGERTMAFGHRDRRADASRGYNPQLEARLRAVLPAARASGTRIVTNMGVANVPAAAEAAVAVARELDLRGLRIAAVEGDDVADLIDAATPLVDDDRPTVGAAGLPVIGANAYLGIEALLPAIEAGADVIIAGRVADPSLFLAPIVHAFGWASDDWPLLGRGTLVGHLLECGMQVTGGYFADPGRKDVVDLATCGFPIAEVAADGSAVITKLDGTGGRVDLMTVKEQLLYEVHDPAAYVTPDVTADFSRVQLSAQGENRVAVTSATGRARPASLKVTIGFDGGYAVEAGLSYAGHNALARAQLAASVLEERFRRVGLDDPIRVDLIGYDSLHQTARGGTGAPADVRVRASMRSPSRVNCELLAWEVEAMLCCGPAGGGGYRGQITPSVATATAYLPRELVRPKLRILTS